MKKKVWILASIVITFTALISVCGIKAVESQQTGNTKETITVNIGIQQSIWPILLAKEKGWFEEEFAKVGAEVKWVEFQSGAQYFEAIASDRLDLGRVGNAPVITGQAANVPFKAIANAGSGSKGNAILVQKNSSIKTLHDLKGKKVAVAKGSSGHDLLIRAIDKAGLKLSDVIIIQLQPDEAKPAFETGAVDAWAIWEPYLSTEKIKKGATVLSDGESLGVYSNSFFIARTKFAEEHPDLVTLYLKVEERTLRWQKEHLEEAIEIYANTKKLDKEIVREVIKNTNPTNLPVTEDVLKAQQDTADFLYNIGVIKQKVDSSKVVDNTTVVIF